MSSSFEPSPHHAGAPPRGPSLRLILTCALIALVCLALGVALGPTIKAWADARRAAAVADKGQAGTWYISQMHPWIIQPEPGQCPICGMDLTPVDPDRFAGEIAIDPVIVQNMGVRIALAERGAISRELRTVGTVALDQTRVVDVVQRFSGWIDRVVVGAQWETVQAGDPLFSIYSPQVLSAEEEWLIAKRAAHDDQGRRLLAAAERKLDLLALPQEERERLYREERAVDTVTVRAPITGVVWSKAVNQGSQIMPQTVAYRLADLSSVWIEATVYEHQLPALRPQQEAVVRLDYGERRELRGRIDRIYPVVDERTREVRVRFVFANSQGETGTLLKPGMFATVFITSQLAEDAVTIPLEAVIGTGDRHVVFVSLGRGKFEPRTVELGPRGSDGRIAIRSGISAGEQVVVSGQFLLDSESRMREALAKVMKGDLASEQSPAAVPVAPAASAPDAPNLDGQREQALREVITRYLAVQDLLYQAHDLAVAAPVASLQERVRAFAAPAEDDPAAQSLLAAAEALDGGSVAALKPGFGALSIALNSLLTATGQPAGLPQALVGMRCGMARGIPEKGVWLQAGDDIRNPYFGAASGMRDCAAEVWAIPQAGGK